jgi:Protein of unknown function (DUF2793)
MPEDKTSRLSLPLLFPGQAQKEVTHNEALVRLDALIYPVVQSALAVPPAGLTVSNDGECWLVANGANGPWVGNEDRIARWSGGSWRFIKAVEGMSVWNIAAAKRLFYTGNEWKTPSPITSPTGGAVMDAESRLAITAILAHLRELSLLPA